MAVRFQSSAANYQSRSSDLLSYNAAYTWMAWCKLVASTGAVGIVYIIRNADGAQSDYLVTGTGGTGVAIAINGGVDGTGDLTEWAVGETHHFAIVRASATDFRLYKNGVQIGATVATNVGTSRTLTAMESGSAVGGAANRWDGHKFGEKAWSAALTAAEIVNEMRTLRPQRTTNLYAFWPGIHNAAADARLDFSGNGRAWTNNGTIAVEDNGAGVGWGGRPIIYPYAAPATQTLTPSLYTDDDTFYAPTVTRGAVNLAPSLLDDGETFYAPTVGSTYALTPELLTDGDTFYAPTVSAGAVTLAPALFTDGDTFYAPTVTPGAVTLEPPLLTDGDTFYSPTVDGGGGFTLQPSLVENAQAFYAPTVTVGAVSLAPSLVTDGETFYAPTITSVATLAPELLTDGDAYYAPTVTVGVATIAPSLFTNEQAFYSATITGGDAPEPAPATDKTRGPGGVRPKRRYWRVYDGEQWVEIHSQDELQAVVAQVEAREERKAREVAAELAKRERVRARTAARKAPEVRIEAPDAPDEVEAVRADVEAVNARLREMYAQALRVELIGKLMRQRLEEDEDEALTLLLD